VLAAATCLFGNNPTFRRNEAFAQLHALVGRIGNGDRRYAIRV
jgi:hypothetical protein